MRAKNTTGQPSVSEYILGRGKLLIADIDASTGRPIGGYRDMGNFPSIAFNYETESQDHKSSRSGLSVTDTTVEFGSTLSGSAQLENVTMDNAKLYFGGTIADGSDVTLAAVGAPAAGNSAIGFTFASEALDGSTKDPGGLWWPLYNVDRASNTTNADRIMEIGSSTDLKVYWFDGTAGAVSGTNFIDITSYCTIDRRAGMVFLRSDWKSIAGTPNWTTGRYISLINTHASSTIAAKKPRRMQLFTATSVSYAVRFVGTNPKDGDRPYEYHAHRVKFSPNGEFGLITDQDFVQIPLTLTIERADDVDPANPYMECLAPEV